MTALLARFGILQLIAFIDTITTAEERAQFEALLFRVLRRIVLAAFGSGALVLSAVTLIGTNATGQPVAFTPSQPDVVRVVPLSPGTATALTVCQQGEKIKLPLLTDPPPPTGSYRYIAQFGASTLSWPDDRINKTAILDGQPVVLSEETIRCLHSAKAP